MRHKFIRKWFAVHHIQSRSRYVKRAICEYRVRFLHSHFNAENHFGHKIERPIATFREEKKEREMK